MPEINQYGQVVNDVVADWQGARILKRTPLSGRFCRLEPLEVQRHAADLFAAYALGDSGWRIFANCSLLTKCVHPELSALLGDLPGGASLARAYGTGAGLQSGFYGADSLS